MQLLIEYIRTPLPFVVLIFGFALFLSNVVLAMKLMQERNEDAKKKAYWQGRKQWSIKGGDTATAQLQRVMAADFFARKLLNSPEAKVFRALDDAVIERNPGWQVMAQVSLGEFLASKSSEAYSCVNSKRVDFALMDEECRVVHALEYQGSGHHQGNAAARDAVKKEALRKAGIGYHEIVAGHTTPKELRQLVEKLVPSAVGGFGKKQRAA